VAAIAYFGVKYFFNNEEESSFVFLFSKVVDSMVSLLDCCFSCCNADSGDFLFFLRQLLKQKSEDMKKIYS
jgi:hypothetical protein